MTKRSRRVLAIALIIVGGGLMLLAPDSKGGLVLLLAGIGIEIVGFTLEKKA